MGIVKALLPAVVLAAGIAGCSSDPAPEAGAINPTASPTVAEETLVEEEVILIDGCGAYYEFDLVSSTIAAGTEDLTRKQKRQLLRDYRGLAEGMVTDMEASVTAGDLPQKALDNATRIKSNLDKAKTKQGSDGISRAQATRIDKSSQRIEALCEAAGDLVPQENLDARTSSP